MKLRINRPKIVVIIISSLLAAFFALGALFFRNNTYEKLAIMIEVIQLVKSNYVDKVDLKKLFRGAFNGLTEALDAESAYLTEEEYEYFRQSLPNKYGLFMARKTPESLIVISRVTYGSSAYNAGLRAGTYITSINEQNVAELSLCQARYLLAVESENIQLSFMREGADQETRIDLKPGEAIVEDVEARIIDYNFGYIKIPNLIKGTSNKVNHSINYLKNKGAEVIILDLRNNCEGLISEAVTIVDYFLDKGLILRLKTRKEKQKLYRANKQGTIYNSFLTVLVNSQTIGASEIIAAAIKDNNRGKILGNRTFGLGLEYTIVPLTSGAAIRVPWAKCLTPKNESIQEKGIAPDIAISEQRATTKVLSKIDDKKVEIDQQFEIALEQIKKLYEDWRKEQK